MKYTELSAYVKQISENRLSPLNDIGYKWQQEKLAGHVEKLSSDSSIIHIKGDFSPYLTNAVYSYLWQAIQQGLKIIRLGPANTVVSENPDSLDDFSKAAEVTIPYFWETIRYDEILKANLQLRQEGSMLVITISA